MCVAFVFIVMILVRRNFSDVFELCMTLIRA